MKFTVEPFYQPHLSEGSARVDAILTVRGAQDEVSPRSGKLEFGLLLDCSNSMQGERMVSTKAAARKLVSRIPDGVRFFVIAFNHEARTVVESCLASEQTRALADRSIAAIEADGGTAMSIGLLEAERQFTDDADATRILELLTDGDNQEDHSLLERAVRAIGGRFQCQCRGVGSGWKAQELLFISNALLGESKALGSGQEIDRDMVETFTHALAKGAADVKLRLIVPPKMARLVSLQQVSPVIVDLTGHGIRNDDRTHDFPTGAWAGEERDFHAVFEIFAPGAIGEQVRVCRIAVINGSEVTDAPPIAVDWSADATLTARLCPQVAHYTGQAELAEATREGLEALDRGDARTATVKLGLATRLAAESNNEEATRRLTRVVDILDEEAGTVRLRVNVSKTDLLDAEVSATRTVRVRK